MTWKESTLAHFAVHNVDGDLVSELASFVQQVPHVFSDHPLQFIVVVAVA